MSKSDFSRWEFIQKWLPDYSINSDVTYVDDLDCYIHGQTENSRYYEMKDQFPLIEEAELELESVESQLFAAALENYRTSQAEELKKRRQEELDKRQTFKVSVEPTYKTIYEIKAESPEEAREIAKRMFVDSSDRILKGFEIKKLDIVNQVI